MSGINAFFEDSLNTPPANERWSCGAVDRDRRRVFLRVWGDSKGLDEANDRILVQDRSWQADSRAKMSGNASYNSQRRAMRSMAWSVRTPTFHTTVRHAYEGLTAKYYFDWEQSVSPSQGASIRISLVGSNCYACAERTATLGAVLAARRRYTVIVAHSTPKLMRRQNSPKFGIAPAGLTYTSRTVSELCPVCRLIAHMGNPRKAAVVT